MPSDLVELEKHLPKWVLVGEYKEMPIYYPFCATCKKPYAHWFATTIYCGECELNGNAANDRSD